VKLGHTTFLTVAGPGTAFGVETAPRFQDFHDGTSSTAILIEVKPELSVPWTAPQDYNLVAENPLGGILVGDDGRWMTGFADGSVRVLRGDLPAETVRHLFEISDGHVLDYQAIR
jgi:hypothetical protein